MKSLSKMTEEELKTLCKSLEERYCENSKVTLKQADFNNMWASIDRYAKENKRLQEQLAEANAIIDLYFPTDKKINSVCIKPINDYRTKWGIK